MARPALVDRLSASDLFMLMWEDYGWCSDMGALAILDGSSLLDDHGGVGIDAVRGRLAPRLHLLPRLRHLLYRPRLGLGWPLWSGIPALVASVSHGSR